MSPRVWSRGKSTVFLRSCRNTVRLDSINIALLPTISIPVFIISAMSISVTVAITVSDPVKVPIAFLFPVAVPISSSVSVLVSVELFIAVAGRHTLSAAPLTSIVGKTVTTV